jgi:hypothetical protein
MAMSEKQRTKLKEIRSKHVLTFDTGAKMVVESKEEPVAQAGVFAEAFPVWEAGKTYKKNEVFTYNGCVGFSRQEGLVASDVYPPFSTGTESIYGVRPIPDAYGVYPYVYNMKAEVGMRVREGDKIYVCKQPADPLVYAPSTVPALFDVETEE